MAGSRKLSTGRCHLTGAVWQARMRQKDEEREIMRVVVPCQLPEDQARARVEKCLTGLKEKYADRISDVEINWQGNSARLSFVLLKPLPLRIVADVAIKPGEVLLEGNLPFIAWPFQTQIEALISDQLRACLA